jgi:hypothetical protein
LCSLKGSINEIGVVIVESRDRAGAQMLRSLEEVSQVSLWAKKFPSFESIIAQWHKYAFGGWMKTTESTGLV